ncbi:hypothetical protein [Streptomyces sp. NPDC030392]|uniref:hypothetical protein n=1 Tax=unclassified Streptomyces TaxID=2593676 RepID=UPI0033EE5D93
MAYGEILDLLRALDRAHTRVGRHASALLLHTEGLGEGRELIPDLRNRVHEGGACELTSLHRFLQVVTPDYAVTNEIDLTVSVRVAEDGCAVRVGVDVHLDEPAGDLPEGRSVLWERGSGTLPLDEALRFLDAAVGELVALENPFGPLDRGRP